MLVDKQVPEVLEDKVDLEGAVEDQVEGDEMADRHSAVELQAHLPISMSKMNLHSHWWTTNLRHLEEEGLLRVGVGLPVEGTLTTVVEEPSVVGVADSMLDVVGTSAVEEKDGAIGTRCVHRLLCCLYSWILC